MAVFKPKDYKKGMTIYAVSVTGDTISKSGLELVIPSVHHVVSVFP